MQPSVSVFIGAVLCVATFSCPTDFQLAESSENGKTALSLHTQKEKADWADHLNIYFTQSFAETRACLHESSGNSWKSFSLAFDGAFACDTFLCCLLF